MIRNKTPEIGREKYCPWNFSLIMVYHAIRNEKIVKNCNFELQKVTGEVKIYIFFSKPWDRIRNPRNVLKVQLEPFKGSEFTWAFPRGQVTLHYELQPAQLILSSFAISRSFFLSIKLISFAQSPFGSKSILLKNSELFKNTSFTSLHFHISLLFIDSTNE